MNEAKEFIWLFEDRFDWLRDNVFLPTVEKHPYIPAEFKPTLVNPSYTDDVIANILRADPTVKGKKRAGKFSEWIVRSFLAFDWDTMNSFTRDDDALKVRPDLELFMRVQSSLPEPDINKAYPPSDRAMGDLWHDMEQIRKHDPDAGLDKKDKIRNQTIMVGDTNSLRVVIPQTYEASKFWGSGTRWCTAADSDEGKNHFDYYNDQGPLIILFDKLDDQKFQMHPVTRSYMDERDNHVGSGKFAELLNQAKLLDPLIDATDGLTKAQLCLWSGKNDSLEKFESSLKDTTIFQPPEDIDILRTALWRGVLPSEGNFWQVFKQDHTAVSEQMGEVLVLPDGVHVTGYLYATERASLGTEPTEVERPLSHFETILDEIKRQQAQDSGDNGEMWIDYHWYERDEDLPYIRKYAPKVTVVLTPRTAYRLSTPRSFGNLWTTFFN